MKGLKVVCSVLMVVSLILGCVSFSFSQEKPSLGQYNFEDYQKLTKLRISKFNESPQLAELVRQGKLPPLEKRLPENPVVVEPIEEIGKYGGTWKFAILGPGDITVYAPMFAESLVKWNRTGNGIVPNVAEKWEIKRAYREFVFYLRKGLKWSDGQPLTADDILFWYEDILQNKELTSSFPSWLVVADTRW